MPGVPSEVLSSPGMMNSPVPDPACCSDDTRSQPGDARPTTLGKMDMPATPTESVSNVNDENVTTAAQCSSELVESEGDEKDDHYFSDSSLVPDVLANQIERKGERSV
ncbi:unnamed protein product [Caretta caretta]